MAFNAGEIIAYLKLDKTEFDAELEEARLQADEPIEVKVKPELDETAVDEVLAEEEPLREDIEPKVKPSYSHAEAESVGRTIAQDILSGVDGSGGGLGGSGRRGADNGLLRALFGEGLNNSEIQSALSNLGFGKAEIRNMLNAYERDFAAAAGGTGGNSGAGPSIARVIAESILPSSDQMSAALERGVQNLSRDGGDVQVRRDLASMFQRLISSAGGPFDALSATGPLGIIMNPIGAGAGVAFLGAFGAAISGGLAATIIGSAGTLAALAPGFLDLMKGYAAYTALTTPGASRAGISPASLGLGRQIEGLIGSGSKILGPLEAQVMPDITKFIAAITKAMPLLKEFAEPAIKAMSGFFGVIDKGLGSGGFKLFVDDMSMIGGQIMTEVGRVLLNLGGAIGGFLDLFGGVGATQIGPWFVKITKHLDDFVHHVQIGHGFITGMVTVFQNLGKVIGAAWDIIKKLADALAPLGLQFFKSVGYLATWVDKIVKFIPPDLITAILGVAIALKGVAIAAGLINSALDINPIVIAVVLLGATIYVLVRYWRDIYNAGYETRVKLVEAWHAFASWFSSNVTRPVVGFFDAMWRYIKGSAQAAWNFIDHNIFQPIANFFVNVFEHTLHDFKSAWDVVWNGIKTTVQIVWKILKPIFDSITTAIKLITAGLKFIFGGGGNLSTYKPPNGGGGI